MELRWTAVCTQECTVECGKEAEGSGKQWDRGNLMRSSLEYIFDSYLQLSSCIVG